MVSIEQYENNSDCREKDMYYRESLSYRLAIMHKLIVKHKIENIVFVKVIAM